MNSATLRLGLWVAALAVLATPAWAQSNVTFQVDMNAALERCAFDPDEDIITVRGSFNDWGSQDEAYTLTDENDDGIYTGTFELEPGNITYKFWGGGNVAWEDGDDRAATIGEEDVTLGVVAFNKTFANFCAGANYLLFFEVDMSIAAAQGRFDLNEDALYVQGDFQGWNNLSEDWRLSQNPFAPEQFTGAFEVTLVPDTTYNYKFAFRTDEGDTWESGSDRQFTPTGEEEIDEATGLRVFTVSRYFDDVTPAEVLDEPATVRFEVDLRPAYYHLLDNDFLPADTQTGEPVTSINGLAINGPAAAFSAEDTAQDWATWGPEALGQIPTRRLFDDGTNGDAVAGDSVYTRTYTYPAGTPRLVVGKFGVDGYDNEGGVGADHHFRLAPGENVIRVNYGCIIRRDGTFTSTNGPVIGEQNFSDAYSPYLLIDNSANPATCVVVRSGGTVGVEPVGRAPEGLVLMGNYPNPAVASTTFEYGLPEAGHVRLEVFDLMGRRVATLVDEVQAANTYRVRFDVEALAPGTYFYRLAAGESVATQRMTVIR